MLDNVVELELVSVAQTYKYELPSLPPEPLRRMETRRVGFEEAVRI
jgi:hypothetical protein